ncbi:hypothetical protein G6723_03150 [Polynucleobacter paneuropaeus]|nr:hypothetical protein G6723_03150 [Polynucleobacter paneuropaeus]
MSWKTVELGEICDITNGSTPLRTTKDFWENGTVNWFTIEDIRKFGREINQTTQFITEQALKKTSLKIVPINTVLLCCTASVGEYAITKIPLTMNQQFNGLILKTDKLLPEYLFHYCSTLKEKLISVSGSTTVNFVAISKLKKITINIPTIATQQKIVVKLDAIFVEIDRAMAAAEANAKNAEALFQSFLENLFLRISKANKPFKLSNFIKLEYGKGLEDSDRELNGIYGAYGANGIKSKTNKFLYDKPSIVVGRKGSAGELTLVEEKFWALDVTYYVTHDIKKTDLTFLYYALKMLNIPSLAKGIKPGINRNDVYDLTVAVPILSEQKSLVEKILFVNKNLEIAKNLYKSKCNELEILKQSILQKAFSGELVKD